MLTEDSLAGWLRRSSRVPGFQSLVGFRIPSAVSRIAKPRIPVSTRKDSPILVSTTSKNFRDSLIRILLLGRFSRLLFSLICHQQLDSTNSLERGSLQILSLWLTHFHIGFISGGFLLGDVGHYRL